MAPSCIFARISRGYEREKREGEREVWDFYVMDPSWKSCRSYVWLRSILEILHIMGFFCQNLLYEICPHIFEKYLSNTRYLNSKQWQYLSSYMVSIENSIKFIQSIIDFPLRIVNNSTRNRNYNLRCTPTHRSNNL